MKPEIKTAWLKALRSGEYPQGKTMLRSVSDKFCCLGVLCDLHSKEVGDEWELDIDSPYRYIYGGRFGAIPDNVANWADLPKSFGEIGHSQGSAFELTLAGLNDNGKTFAQIAEVIEKEF